MDTNTNFSHVLYLIPHHTIPSLNDPEKKAFENIVRKIENTGYQHFLLFPQSFSFSHKVFMIYVTCKCFHLDQSKILLLNTGLSRCQPFSSILENSKKAYFGKHSGKTSFSNYCIFLSFLKQIPTFDYAF